MEEHKFSHQFIKNVCSGPLKILMNTIIVFFSYRYFLQVFGVEKYSIWLLLGVIIDFSRLGNLGVNDIIIKYVAEAKGKQDKVRLCEYMSSSLMVITAFTLLIGIPLLMFKSFVPHFLHILSDFIPLFDYMYDKILFLSFLLIVLELFLGILFGLGRADLANYLQSTSSFFGTLLSIILIYLKFDFVGLYIGTLVGTVGVIVLSLYYIYNVLGYFPFKLSYLKMTIARDIIRNSIIMFTASIINLFFLPAGKILISKYIGSTEVVCYDLAFKLGFQIRALFDLALKALVTEFSSVQGDYQKLYSLLKKVYKYLLIMALPTYGVIFFFSSQLLNLWLGNAYIPLMDETFRIISIGFIVNLLAVPIYYLLLAYGHFNKLLGAVIVQSSIAFILWIIYFKIFCGKIYFIFLYITVLSMISAAFYLFFFFKYKVNNNILMIKEN